MVGVPLMDRQKTDFIAHAHGLFVHLRLRAGKSLTRQKGPSQTRLDQRAAFHRSGLSNNMSILDNYFLGNAAI
jgi:hypothetical protein